VASFGFCEAVIALEPATVRPGTFAGAGRLTKSHNGVKTLTGDNTPEVSLCAYRVYV